MWFDKQFGNLGCDVLGGFSGFKLCVCVCPDKTNIMGTKCTHKVGNLKSFWDIFGSHERNSL